MIGQPGLDELSSRFALVVFWVNGLLMKAGERVTRPVGQSSARWQVLGRAGMPPPQTVSQMARDMGLARQSVQRVVDALKNDGLVTLEAIPGDKRTSFVELTEEGRKVLAAIYKRNAAWARQISRRISDAEFETAIASLERVGTILKEDLGE